jgi:TPR repeat protein
MSFPVAKPKPYITIHEESTINLMQKFLHSRTRAAITLKPYVSFALLLSYFVFLSASRLVAQGSLLDSESSSVTSNVSFEARDHWERALSMATRTGPNSAIFHQSSIGELEAAANAGHPFAQYWLSELYFAHALVSGYTIMGLAAADDANTAWSQTDSVGIRLLAKSAEQGVSLSEYKLWGRFKNGQGVPKNQATAELWLKRAADSGLAKAEYDYASLLADRGEFEEAKRWNRLAAKQAYYGAAVDQYAYDAYKYIRVMTFAELKDAANAGDPVAARVLGIELQSGGKFPADLPAALSYEMKAAELGDPVAEYNVGIEFWKGQNRTEDDAMGVRWLLKSAKQGDPDAQMCVGLAYDTGDGVVKDRALAVQWYQRAASQGDYEAADNLAEIYKQNMRAKSDAVKIVRLYDIGARQSDKIGIREYMRMFAEEQVVYRNEVVSAR